MFNELNNKIAAFPQELKDLDRWCNWMYVTIDGVEKKIPYDSKSEITKVEAKANDESTWSDFETAKNRINMKMGAGLYFKEPYVGIDLDDVEDEIKRHMAGDYEDNIVSEFIHELDSYTEISPSGTGIHILIKGELPEGRRHYGNVEMYDGGRYFTVTFNSIGLDYIRDDHDTKKIAKLHKKYMPAKKVKKRPQQTPESEMGAHGLSDTEVIKRASRSKQGEKIKTLLAGDWDKYEEYPSQSEADMALANMLAFWTARDREQMDRIIRGSGLYRPKWDEMRGHDTYGNIVIDLAASEVDNVYTPVRSKTFKPKTIDEPYTYNEETRQDADSFPIRSADDTGNAKRLTDRYGDIMKYSYNRNKFYIYDGKVWLLDDLGRVNKLVDNVVEAIEDEEWEVKEMYDPKEQEEEEKKVNGTKMKHLTRSRSNHAKTGMVSQVKHQVPVSPEEFDAEGSLLNTPNGYIDLATGEVLPPDKDKMFSMITEGGLESDKEPTEWLKFLDETFEGDQEMIDFMQRAAGYSLTGSIREEVMFILHGNGQNGKSKFVEGIRYAMGTYTNNIQARTLMVRSTETINNDIAKLQRSRMVTSSEPGERFVFDEGLVKQLTGGDIVTARFLFGEEFNFHPEFKLWLTTNVKPIIKGTDEGIWRRIVLIPFERKVAEEDKDEQLMEKFKAEKDGILQWIIEGTLEWQEKGLQLPDKVIEASKTYRNEMDELGQFIEDECELGDDLEDSGGDLYRRYKYWADETENQKMNKNRFGQKLKEKFTHKKKSAGIFYQGLKLT